MSIVEQLETGPYKMLNSMAYALVRELKHQSKVSPHLHWAPCSTMEDLMGMTSRLVIDDKREGLEISDILIHFICL